MGYRAMAPDALRGVPGNAAILDRLAEGAEPVAGTSPYAIDAFVLRTHPDLCERLVQLSEGLSGASAVGVFGLACLIDRDQVVRAVARGTSGLWLRLPETGRAGLGPDESWPAMGLGSEWIGVDAWQTVRPFADGTAWLRRLVAAAFGEPIVA